LQAAAAGAQPNLPPYSPPFPEPGVNENPGSSGGQWLPRPSVVTPASGQPTQPDTLMPQLPAVPTMSLSTIAPGAKSAGGDDVNFDDLARRFEELKKRK